MEDCKKLKWNEIFMWKLSQLISRKFSKKYIVVSQNKMQQYGNYVKDFAFKHFRESNISIKEITFQ